MNGPGGAMVMTVADGKTMTMPEPKPMEDPVPAIVPVPAVVPTPAGVFNNINSQIGTQVAGSPQQILSQTITPTGAVVQTPVVGPIPVVPASTMTPTPGMTMTTMVKPSMTMVMPGMTMPGMTMAGFPGMTMMRPGMPGTTNMNGKFLALLYSFFNFHCKIAFK